MNINNKQKNKQTNDEYYYSGLKLIKSSRPLAYIFVYRASPNTVNFQSFHNNIRNQV